MSHTLIILLLDGQVRELCRHDPPWRAAGDDGILGKVSHAGMLPEEVFVQLELTVHHGRRGPEHG